MNHLLPLLQTLVKFQDFPTDVFSLSGSDNDGNDNDESLNLGLPSSFISNI